jgi:hypothetical protein
MDWVRGHAKWAAILTLSAATFSVLIANAIVLPLILLFLTAGILVFRYFDAIKAFEFWALDEWARAIPRSIGIREWYAPYHAAELFCDPSIVKSRNEAAAKMNNVMMNLIKDPRRIIEDPSEESLLKRAAMPQKNSTGGRHVDYDAALAEHDLNNLALSRDLRGKLFVGNLIAKGLPDATQLERIIPRSDWKIMSLDISKAEAFGPQKHYTDIVIGKGLARLETVRRPELVTERQSQPGTSFPAGS